MLRIVMESVVMLSVVHWML